MKLALISVLVFCILFPQITPFPQAQDSLRYGRQEFFILQDPLWEYINAIERKENRRVFDFTNTTNHRGYVANWIVDENRLYLTKITGTKNGKRVKMTDLFDQVLPNGHIEADWFTGFLHLPIGPYEYETDGWPASVVLKIDKGRVVKIEATVPGDIPHGWNGVREEEKGANGTSDGTVEPSAEKMPGKSDTP